MGRKGSWFSSVKKALSPDSKEKKSEMANKSKKKWFGKEKPSVSEPPAPESVEVSLPDPNPHPHPLPLPPLEEANLTETKNEQANHAHSVAVATAAAAESAVAAAQAAAEVVRLTTLNQYVGKSKEEVAAIRIQTAFRGYLARRALRALRGLFRLKSLVDGPTVRRQTSNTLKCMQTLSRVQGQIQLRRNRMSEENRALQRQLLQKRARELESLRMGEEWDDSLQSKEQIEASLLHRYEAAMRRERALAYSYTHQQTWKKSTKPTNLLFMDLTNPQWGWSWLERWMVAPAMGDTDAEKDLNSDRLSVKSASPGEITKSFARHQLNSDNPSSPASQTTPSPKGVSSSSARKLKSAIRKGIPITQDFDMRSTFSVQSERNRRHSIGSSTIRDDKSLASSPSVPSYMAPTRSVKAKSKFSGPSGRENGGAEQENGSTGLEKGSASPAKKRLSFPPSPARPRGHSGPPKLDSGSIVDSDVNGVVN